ncbi:MAG: phage tail protein [Bacteroidales bacterium]|nr:phage tail protein [Bacteroidales bacterium]
MIFQLDDKVYSGLSAPTNWSYSGGDANIAEYALLGVKPRIQHTGEALNEISLSFKFRLEYCNPDEEIKQFDTWKSEGSILPLLIGNGEYIGDYIVKSVSKNINQLLNDGTIVDAGIDVSLLEFVPYSEEEMQQSADRRNALAVDTDPNVNQLPEQPLSPEAMAHESLMESQIAAWEAANQIEDVVTSEEPETLFDKAMNEIDTVLGFLETAEGMMEEAQQGIQDYSGISGIMGQLTDAFNEAAGMLSMPFSASNLEGLLLLIQDLLNELDLRSSDFTNDVILNRV